MSQAASLTAAPPSHEACAERRIAVFDSGIAGTILTHRLKTSIACAEWINIVDHDRFPYADRSEAEVARRVVAIVHDLERRGTTDLILVCATASAVWWQSRLYERFPNLRVHDMVEPASKAAAWHSVEKIYLAGTPLALKTGIHEQVIRSFVVNRKTACTAIEVGELAPLIEEMANREGKVEEIIRTAAKKVRGYDRQVLLLSSAHYSLRLNLWQRHVPPGTIIVDPVEELVRSMQLRWGASVPRRSVPVHYFTSGDPDYFTAQAERMGNRPIRVERFTILNEAA